MTTRRHARKMRAPSAPNSDINVTPLVDVVLVMLIIFMVVTPLLEKDIGVRVPSTEKVEQPTEVPPEQIVVKLDAAGAITVNAAPVEQGAYIERLRTLLAPRAQPDKVVFVSADDAASYARLVSVLDGARQAGAATLGMVTEPPPDAPAPP